MEKTVKPLEPNWGVLDFEVLTAPVYTKVGDTRIPIPSRRAIIRGDRDQVLALVSSRYKLVQHREVFNPIHDAIKELKLKVRDVKTSTALAGSYASVEWILDHQVSVIPNDVVSISLIGRNSYDKSSRLVLALGALRIRTNSSLLSPAKDHEIGWRHWRSLSLQEVMQEINKLLNELPDMLTLWHAWAETPVDADTLQYWMKIKGSVTKQYIGNRGERIIVDKFNDDKGTTVWDAYNAINFFGTHHLRGHDTNKIAVRRDRISRLANEFGRWAGHA